MAKKKPTAKKPAKRSGKLAKMTVVCDDHHKCLRFAKAVKAAAMKVKGKDGEKLRKLATGFIPG